LRKKQTSTGRKSRGAHRNHLGGPGRRTRHWKVARKKDDWPPGIRPTSGGEGSLQKARGGKKARETTQRYDARKILSFWDPHGGGGDQGTIKAGRGDKKIDNAGCGTQGIHEPKRPRKEWTKKTASSIIYPGRELEHESRAQIGVGSCDQH